MSNERKLLKEALNFINFVSTTDGSGLALRIKEELDKPEPILKTTVNQVRYWANPDRYLDLMVISEQRVENSLIIHVRRPFTESNACLEV